jgi:cytosine/adenosine deaminase-related metal-dependent hydrolase
MFEELSFAWACLRGATTSAGSEEAREFLKAATVEPTKLFGLPRGGIAKGEKATFVILARGENLLNISDVYAGLVNRARADNLRAVYVNGKII